MALAAAGPASAGAISGMLTKPGNKPLGVAYAKLVRGSAESATKSHALGNYSLAIAASGLCTVSVGSGKSGTVLLGNNPVRYNFEVPDSGVSLQQR